MLITTISMSLPTFASTGNSIDTVIENLSELNKQEAESGKELEESAECRIIVKASRKPDTYGDAQFVKGTDKIYIYQYSDITSANAALEYYNTLSYVQWAETDGIMEGQSLSYGNDMMGSDEAKNYIKNNNISTNEVNVAVIDGGINFKKKDFISSGRVIDSGVNLSDSGTKGTAQEDRGKYHGSNITSILLDNTTDNVNIIGYKALDYKGFGSDSAISASIIKAVDDGANILNCSISAKGASKIIEEAIGYAINKDVVVVVAAGNECDNASKYCPAYIDGVYTVGALDYNGNRAIFSNYGEVVDFVAPGYNVEVYGSKNMSSVKPDYANGTSFAVPYIASAAAMVLSLDKDLSIDDVKQKLIDSCINQKELNYNSKYLSAVEISIEYLGGFTAVGSPDNESICYGYGMPQMQKLVGLVNKCSSPEFSVLSGIYSDEFELEITSDSNSEIYYTTDGSYPSNESTKYTSPLTISSTASIRAIAYSDKNIKSSPSAREYKIEYLADESDFEIDERGYITKYNGKGKNGNYIEIKVPDTIKGKVVKGVAKRAFYDVADEEEIETFSEYDLHLKGISLPDTVEEIEDEAFFNLFSLKYFTANGLKTVGDFALEAPIVYFDSPKVESIGVRGLVTNLEKIDLPMLKTIGDSAFCENLYLCEVNLPSVVSGGNSVFKTCYRLKNVNMNSCEVLGDESFNLCRSLKTAFLPNLSTITYESFSGSIYTGMFGFCTSLNSIDLPNLKTIESGVKKLFYYCENLAEFNAPKLESICSEMFSDCYMLDNVKIPKAELIGERAFYYNISLDDLFIPNVKNISKEAFCNSTISYIDAAELLTLESYVFSGKKFDSYLINAMSKIGIKIVAPKLKEVSDYAFAYTKMIHNLNLPSLNKIGENAFYKSSVNYLYAPKLETPKSLPTTENSTIILSSLFKNCTENTKGRNYKVYGITGSDAEIWAKANVHTFIGIPIIITDISDDYDGENPLIIDAVGIDLCYKWYGSDDESGLNSVLLNTEMEGNFNPLDYKYYPYYFCECEMKDNGKIFSVKSQTCKNNDYRLADYSKLDELKNKIPEDLSFYTDECVEQLNSILNNIEWNLPITEQNIVNGYVIKLEKAICNLEYKKADLDKLNQAINSVPENLSVYTDESVKTLINLIEKAKEYENADITKQAETDALAQQINNAVDALEIKEILTEPSTNPSEESTTQPSVASVKPRETTTENSSNTKNNQNAPKRNTDTKSPLTGNYSEYINISIASLSCICVLLIVNSKRKKKSF